MLYVYSRCRYRYRRYSCLLRRRHLRFCGALPLRRHARRRFNFLLRRPPPRLCGACARSAAALPACRRLPRLACLRLGAALRHSALCAVRAVAAYSQRYSLAAAAASARPASRLASRCRSAAARRRLFEFGRHVPCVHSAGHSAQSSRAFASPL
jgi:hypothetical protein